MKNNLRFSESCYRCAYGLCSFYEHTYCVLDKAKIPEDDESLEWYDWAILHEVDEHEVCDDFECVF